MSPEPKSQIAEASSPYERLCENNIGDINPPINGGRAICGIAHKTFISEKRGQARSRAGGILSSTSLRHSRSSPSPVEASVRENKIWALASAITNKGASREAAPYSSVIMP